MRIINRRVSRHQYFIRASRAKRWNELYKENYCGNTCGCNQSKWLASRERFAYKIVRLTPRRNQIYTPSFRSVAQFRILARFVTQRTEKKSWFVFSFARSTRRRAFERNFSDSKIELRDLDGFALHVLIPGHDSTIFRNDIRAGALSASAWTHDRPGKRIIPDYIGIW